MNFRVQLFLAKMRWFGDKLIVLLTEVVIDLYIVIVAGCFLRNVMTLLNVKLPVEETGRQENRYDIASLVLNKYVHGVILVFVFL